MSLGLRKCAVLHMVGGRVVGRGDLRLTSDETLPVLNPGENYRYMEKANRTILITRVQQVLSSYLNSSDKTRAHNTCLLQYYLHAG